MAGIAALVVRREPQRTEQYSGALNVRAPEGVYVSEMNDPIRETDWADVGKPPGHRRSRMQIAVFTNIREYFAVMRDEFTTPLALGKTGAQTPKGEQGAWRERINISRDPAMAYGSLFTLDNTSTFGY